jgi:hypothetical protein
VIGAPLALPARTRYNTSGLERSLLWPGLACLRMAGFEVSTEAIPLARTSSENLRASCGPADTSTSRSLSCRRR